MFHDLLNQAQRVLLTTHVRPDGDALGTTAALSLFLQTQGKHVDRLLLSPMPNKYRFVYDEAGLDWIERVPELSAYDTLLVCDTGTWGQLPGLREVVEPWSGKKLVLDHHVTQEEWADAKFVETKAAAAAELAAEIVGGLTKPIADALYVGIVSDTGWFRYSNTTPNTLRLAARCLESGADADGIYARLYQSETEQRLRLQADVQQTLTLHDHLAVLRCTQADLAKHGVSVTATEDVVNWPLQIREVAASVLLVEMPDGVTKLSFRSKPGGADVAALAAHFGGGGHVRAAGARLDCDLATAEQKVVAALTSTG